MATITIASSFDIQVGTVTASTITVAYLAGKDGTNATGDVVGPASAVDENIAVFDSTTGKLIKDSLINKSAIVANTAKVTNANHTGDATGSTALTLANDVITLAKAGIRYKTRVTSNVVTSYAIDRNAGSTFELTMTGACTFTDSNLASGTNTEVISIILDGNFVPTFPVYWEVTPSSDSYDGTKRNLLVVETVVGTGGSEDVIYSLENLTT